MSIEFGAPDQLGTNSCLIGTGGTFVQSIRPAASGQISAMSFAIAFCGLDPRHSEATFRQERTMPFKRTANSIVTAIAATASLAAWGQNSAPLPSRADVKAETRTAGRSGQLTPTGEGSPVAAPQPRSTKTRAQRKAETLQSRIAGELPRAGLEPEWKAARQEARVPSTTTRAERKSATLAAARANQLKPAGEAAQPNR